MDVSSPRISFADELADARRGDAATCDNRHYETRGETMNRFKNILVGVDLAAGDRLVADTLFENAQAVRQAMWLAKLNNSRIKFVYSLDISERAQQLIQQSAGEHTVLDQARDVLRAFAEHAAEQGVNASFEVVFGRSWAELIRQVLKSHHDLVLVGTRNQTATSRVLFGSTCMKLLRKCPCPVWITKPSDQPHIASVLVAHDLSPVGSLALQLGASLSQLQNAALHVLHVLEPDFESLMSSDLPVGTAADRGAAARSQIETELQGFYFATAPQITISEGEPSAAILPYIDQYSIELVAMGTIARSGVSGLFVGNTAERLLPQLPCSVLAVKPVDFISPVKLL
jgi:universal stress protein E